MSHMPVDHPLRGFYRGLTVLTGVAAAGYGAVALLQTSDHPFFDRAGESVLGMKTNAAAGLLWVIIGAVALITSLIGRNLDAKVNAVFGPMVWVVGTIALCLIRTSDNVLATSITSVCALYVVGTILLTASLYSPVSGAPRSRPASDRPAAARESVSASR
jgi:hypothetical protein